MSEPETNPVPRTVRLAALLAAVEGVILVGLAVFFVVELLRATATDTGGALAAAGVQLFGGALLLLVARGLRRVAPWSRSPSVVLQVLFLPVGYTLAFQSDQPWWGVPVLVLAVGELYLLFTPEARRAFEEASPRR